MLIIASSYQLYINSIFPQPEDEKIYRKNLFDMSVRSGLSNYHLRSVDRSCSAFGFEVRPPYMFDDVVELALQLPIDFKTPDKNTTKMILKEVALPYLKKYGLEEILSRKKYGMPAALDHIKDKIEVRIDELIPTETISNHPYKKYFKTSMDILMFDLFHHFFIEQKGKHPTNFSLVNFYKERNNERMYC